MTPEPKTAVEFLEAMRGDSGFAAQIEWLIHREYADTLERRLAEALGIPAPCPFCGSLDLRCSEPTL